MKHLTDDQLSARLDRTLSGREREEADRHLAACARCRDALATLGAQDRMLGMALAHEPGDAYFETFAARVEDRLRAEGLRGAQARLGEDRWFGWLRGPRRVAWAAALATVVVGAGIVLIVTRDTPLPTAANRDIERRIAQSAPAPAASSPVMPAPAKDEPLAKADAPTATVAPPSAGAPVATTVAPVAPEAELHVRGGRAVETKPGVAEEALAERVAARDRAVPAPEEREAALSRMREVRKDGTRGPATPASELSQPGPQAAPAPEGGVRVLKRGGAAPMRTSEKVVAPAAEAPTAQAETAPAPASETAPAPALLQSDRSERDESATSASEAEVQRVTAGARGTAPPLAGGFTDAVRPGEVRLCGRVVDTQGRPVARASLTLVSIGRTAASDEAGAFCLAAPIGSYELSAMAVGFESARVQVRVAGEQADVHVTMKPISVLGEGFAQAPGTAPRAANEAAKRAVAAKPAPAKPAPARPAPAKAQDPFAGESKGVAPRVAEAREATRTATIYPTLPTWNKAAAAWEAVLPALTTPDGISEARYRIAQARLGSWRLFPTVGHRNAVMAACTAVLAGAPTLEQRKDVMKWMAEVRRGPTGRG